MAYVDHYTGPRIQAQTTPPSFFEGLNARYRFTMDGAASWENALLPKFSGIGAPITWAGERVFCNPPWNDIASFVELAAGADLAVLLVPARTNCRWFHRALNLGARVEFFLGKLKFNGAKWNSPVDCLLLVFGDGRCSCDP